MNDTRAFSPKFCDALAAIICWSTAQAVRAFGLPLLLLMGIGPLIAWRRTSFASLATTFRWPTGVALTTGVVLLLLGAGSSVPGLVAYTFSAFVIATIVMEFARGTRARKALADGRGSVEVGGFDFGWAHEQASSI